MALTSQPDWSNLPNLPLALISLHLSPIDRLRFRQVCTSWLAAAPHKLPWLLAVSFEESTLHYQLLDFKVDAFARLETLTVDQLPQSTVVDVQVPDFQFIAVLHGWLTFCNSVSPSRISFFNPLSKSMVSLPPLPLPPYPAAVQQIIVSDRSLSKVLVILSYKKPTTRDLPCRPWEFVLALCGVGDKDWTLIGNTLTKKFSDMVGLNGAFHKGRFYFVVKDEMYMCGSSAGELELVRVPVDFPDELLEKCLCTTTRRIYLVSSSSLLLLLVLESNFVDVFQVEVTERSVKVVKVTTSLGDSVFFVRLRIVDFVVVVRGECVYLFNKGGDEDKLIRVCNLVDGTSKFISRPDWPKVTSWIEPHFK